MAAQRVKNGPEPGAPLEDDREVVVNILAVALESLRFNCAAKADVSMLGKLQGKHPGLKALTAWARETLHPSLSLFSLKTNNLFEITFTSLGEFTPSYILHTRAFGTYLLGGLFTLQKNYKVMVFYM